MTSPSLRVLFRRLVSVGAALAFTISLSFALTEAASAAGSRTWTFTGVTFEDGGQLTGSFAITDAGEMTNVVITTSGGDTSTYGTTFVYDVANTGGEGFRAEEGWYGVMLTDGSRYLKLPLGDLADATEGDVVPLLPGGWECFNCSPWREISSGSVVAGPGGSEPPPTGVVTVSAPAGLQLAGRYVAVTTRGLANGEPYTIRIAGVEVGSGQAAGPGAFTRSVRVPRATSEGTASITVAGVDRTAATSIAVVARKTLGLHLAHRVLQTRHRQRITVRGLVAGEPVRVKYRGVTISPRTAHADSDGVYRTRIRVGRLAGTKGVMARGAFYGRRAETTFRVVPG